MSTDEDYLRMTEVFGTPISLMRPWMLIGPFLVAVGVGFAALSVAPEITSDEPPQWLTSLFGTAAQIIATLVVALALEARYVQVRPATAGFTMAYVSLGLVAAATGASANLPHSAYAVLLGLTAGCGLGALTSVALVGFEAFRSEAAEVRRGRVDDIRSPTKLASVPPDKPPPRPGEDDQETPRT